MPHGRGDRRPPNHTAPLENQPTATIPKPSQKQLWGYSFTMIALACACSLNSANPCLLPPAAANLGSPIPFCVPDATAFSLPTPASPAAGSNPLIFLPNSDTGFSSLGTRDEPTASSLGGVTANPVEPTETDRGMYDRRCNCWGED